MTGRLVTIHWCAFGTGWTTSKRLSSATLRIDEPDDMTLLDAVFRATNIQQGELWGRIEPLLKPYRTHTSISTGDTVTIDRVTYILGEHGWEVKA